MNPYPPSGANAYVAAPPNSYQHPVFHATLPQHAQSQYGQSYPPPNSGAWTTTLCGCCTDCRSCCLGCWCPSVLVGRSVEAIDQGQTSCFVGGAIFCLLCAFTGLGCLYTCMYRTRLRQQHGLPEHACGDFCTDCCCLHCSICQVYREIENRKVQPMVLATGYPVAPTAPSFQSMSK